MIAFPGPTEEVSIVVEICIHKLGNQNDLTKNVWTQIGRKLYSYVALMKGVVRAFLTPGDLLFESLAKMFYAAKN